MTYRGVSALPDDEWVLFTVRSQSHTEWDQAQIAIQSVTTGERQVVLEGGRDARYLSTGHLVYGLNNVLFAVPFDVGSRRVIGGPVPLIEGVRSATHGINNGAMQFSVSANGSLVYVPGTDDDVSSSLTWVQRNGDQDPLAAPVRVFGHPRVSSDETRLAVEVADGDNVDVWIWDVERVTLSQLTFHAAVDSDPLWTPDGSRVVFISSRDGGGLFWKAADGTGQVERLMQSSTRVFPMDWSADGRVVFTQLPGDVGVLSLDNERSVEMLLDTEALEYSPALSPDGQWLAYTFLSEALLRVYVRPFPNIDDGLWLVSENGANPVWSPNGLELFYRSELVGVDGRSMMAVPITTEPTFSVGTPEPLFSLDAYLTAATRQWDMAPDGNSFVFQTPITTEPSTEADSFNGLIFVQNWFEELKRRIPIN